ncbi:MAG: thiamine phosphate synthase, partial [Gemmatimonadetes bacterium]|nr:thiamine phosphate synthase [Gemmatimonadota bacterium]
EGGRGFLVGKSIHAPRQAAAPAVGGLDYLVLGSVYETASHPGGRPIGAGAVAEAAAAATVPVLAIGGVGPGRVSGLLARGAHGVVVKSGVWGADDPARAVTRYLDMLHVEG